MLTSCKRGLESQSGEELEGRATAMSKLLLHSDHHGRIRCALWSTTIRVRTPGSGHEDSGCQMQPASTYNKAKWRAYQTHVYIKGVSW